MGTKKGAKTGAKGAKTTKSAEAARKTAAGARKTAVGARKTAVGARKTAVGARKTAVGVRKTAVGARKVGEREIPHEELERTLAKVKEPSLPEVTLEPPEHQGRKVTHPVDALKRARRRLLLAWRFREALAPALPKLFHETAWTAYHALRRSGAFGSSTTEKNTALDALVDELGLIRRVVGDTTRPGDKIRTGFRFDLPLRAGSPLLDAAPEILAAAKEAQGTIPALTDDVLAAAQTTLTRAKSATDDAQAHDDANTGERAALGDDTQLALDVLLDSLDHLSAAARVVFRKKPIAQAYFVGALEPHAHAATSKGGAQPVTGTPPAGGEAT